MSSVIFQSAMRVISQVLQWLQTSSQTRTSNLVIDTFGAGIDNSTTAIGEGFIVVPGSNNTPSTPTISVTTGGIAYDNLGNRIFISPSDTTLYNPTNPSDTTNDGLGNFLSTPKSTGCVNIPLTQTSQNYLWIDYLATIDTTAFTLNKETNAKQFYKQTDGYIITVTTINVAPDSGSIYLANINMTGGGAVQFSNISQTGRSYFNINPNIVPIHTPLANLSDRTPSYAPNTSYTLEAHIKAVGTGTGISPTNPHNMSLADLGVSQFDTVNEHRILEHGNGIITGTPGTPYPSTSAMATSINVVNPGSDYLTVEELLSSEFAIINGSAFTVFQIFGTPPSNARVNFPTTPGSSGVYNVYWDSVIMSFGTTTGDISTDNTKLWIATVTWTLTGAFTITSVTDGTHLVVNSTSGMNIGDTLVQGSATTTITTVTDSTHLVVGSTTGFSAGNALDTSLHNSLSTLIDRRRIGSTTHLMQRWITNARPGVGSLQPQSGEFGFNLTSNVLEYWDGSAWQQPVNSSSNTTVPTGALLPFAGSVAPSGFLMANGASVSTVSFPNLFAVIGYTYGGAGSSFNLPNLVNNVPVGAGGSIAPVIGNTSGATTETFTPTEAPHKHVTSVGDNGSGATVYMRDDNPYGTTPATTTGQSWSTSAFGSTTLPYLNTSSTTATINPVTVPTVQPSLGVNFIIKI